MAGEVYAANGNVFFTGSQNLDLGVRLRESGGLDVVGFRVFESDRVCGVGCGGVGGVY